MASTSDPTWGQGMSLALRDVRVLYDKLTAEEDWNAAGHAYAEEHDRGYTAIRTVDSPALGDPPFVTGPKLGDRRIAMISTAGLITRGARPFVGGDADYRAIPADVAEDDLLVSHVSVNFDRTGFQQDLNVMLPCERLYELDVEGAIGKASDEHYSFMGATDPEKLQGSARELGRSLLGRGVNTIVLAPV